SLDKLRHVLRARGVVSTSSALAAVLANQAVGATPAGLATTIANAALTNAGTAAGGLLGFLAMTKLQTGIAATLVIGGAIGALTQQRTINELRGEPPRAQKTATLTSERSTPVEREVRQ